MPELPILAPNAKHIFFLRVRVGSRGSWTAGNWVHTMLDNTARLFFVATPWLGPLGLPKAFAANEVVPMIKLCESQHEVQLEAVAFIETTAVVS